MHPDDVILNDYVDESLTGEALEQVRRHLGTCASCHEQVTDLLRVKRAAAALREQPIDPPARVWSRIERATAPTRPSARPAFFDTWASLAAAAVIVMAVAYGLFAGGLALGRRQVPTEPPDAQIAALRQEVRDMRQTLMLSLLQQRSASERLNGVRWADRLDNPGSEVEAALLDTLMHDPNMNVRLATVDALKRFGADAEVRRGAVAALGQQTSPLVQLALIDFVAETSDRGSTDALRRLSQDPMVDQAVRQRAALAAQRIG